MISNDLPDVVLRLALEICRMNGDRAGSRTCQDWSGEFDLNSVSDDHWIELMRIFEAANSNGREFDPSFIPRDEMVISYAVAEVLKAILDGKKNNTPTIAAAPEEVGECDRPFQVGDVVRVTLSEEFRETTITAKVKAILEGYRIYLDIPAFKLYSCKSTRPIDSSSYFALGTWYGLMSGTPTCHCKAIVELVRAAA